MNVFKTDPKDLIWQKNDRVINLFVQGNKTSKTIFRKRITSPTDREFRNLLEKTKEVSNRVTDRSVFLVMSDNSLTMKVPFVEYLNGELEAYCRPSWIKGAER
jgi:hypothetical protein